MHLVLSSAMSSRASRTTQLQLSLAQHLRVRVLGLDLLARDEAPPPVALAPLALAEVPPEPFEVHEALDDVVGDGHLGDVLLRDVPRAAVRDDDVVERLGAALGERVDAHLADPLLGRLALVVEPAHDGVVPKEAVREDVPDAVLDDAVDELGLGRRRVLVLDGGAQLEHAAPQRRREDGRDPRLEVDDVERELALDERAHPLGELLGAPRDGRGRVGAERLGEDEEGVRDRVE